MGPLLSKQEYNGHIKPTNLGRGSNSIVVGGENCFPFYFFEGNSPNLPRVAMEVYDTCPTNWPDAAVAPFSDVISSPVEWARKCVTTYSAETICLNLSSTDPNGADASPEEAANLVKTVADEIRVPIIVWGTANPEKDADVLRAVCQTCPDKKLIIGPVEEKNHKKIAAVALAFGHTLVASSSMDINLAKQLNILLSNVGAADDQMLIDPTVSSIGYGIEYCYSVIERMRIAALTQQDERLSFPIVLNIANEIWKSKEASISEEENPLLGKATVRGIMLEALSAWVLLLAGGNIAIMRHPEAIKLVKEMILDLSL